MTLKNRHVFELRLGKVGLIVFISGMSLMLFSIFLLGIIVGKHMEAYPERYSSGIPELIRDSLLAVVLKQGKVAPPAADQERKMEPASGEADFGLTFYDTLGGKKGGTIAGTQTGTTKYKPSEIPVKHAAPVRSAPEMGSPAAPPETTKSESVPPAPGGGGGIKKPNPEPGGMPAGEALMRKPPAEEAALQGKGHFEVQVAAYRERLPAEQLVKKFVAQGFSPRVVMKELPGKGRWFRVIVGNFESRRAAQAVADQMAGKISGLKCVIRSTGGNGNGG
jgi:cell division septation protein DedD